jgi:hypothetical protein
MHILLRFSSIPVIYSQLPLGPRKLLVWVTHRLLWEEAGAGLNVESD